MNVSVGSVCLQRVSLLDVCGKIVVECKIDPYLVSFETELLMYIAFRRYSAINLIPWSTFWQRPVPYQHRYPTFPKILRSFKLLILVAVVYPHLKIWIKKREAILEAFILSQLSSNQIFSRYRNLNAQDREFVRLTFPTDFQSLSAQRRVFSRITSRRLRMLMVLMKMNRWERQWVHFKCLTTPALARIANLHDFHDVVNIDDIFQEIIAQPRHVTYPVAIGDIPVLTKWYFPPCVVSILDRLKQHGDIRPSAAMQLMDFCNDIGLSRQDILALVQTLAQEAQNGERTCRVARHAPRYMEALLGLEGSERQAGGFLCKSLEEKPIDNGPDISGGCYFRQVVRFGNQLQEDFNAAYIPQRKVAEIESLIQEGKYSQACGTHACARYKKLGSAPTMWTPVDYYCHARRSHPTIPTPEAEELTDIEDLDLLIRPWRATPRSCNM